MKIRNLFFVAAVILAAVALAGCGSSGGGGSGGSDLPPVPEGAERLSLVNGAYAIFRFDLPAGAKWSDYNKITAEYMVDEENIRKPQRNRDNVRLMGNYTEEQSEVSYGFRVYNLNEGFNGPYIIDNTPRTFATLGAVADEWFTIEYNITGSAAHSQFIRANLPAPDATGPFFFGIGIPGEEGGRRSTIVQLVRNVTLHHATNPELNVVSTGSGFEEQTLATYYPIGSSREK